MAKKKAMTPQSELVVAHLQKKFGASSAIIPGKTSPLSAVAHVVPTGVDVVDRYIAAIGGLGTGKITEVFSEPGVAKSTFMWTVLAGVQRMGGLGVMSDLERAYDQFRAPDFGIDNDSLVLQEPETLEQALDQTQEVAEFLPDGGPPTVIALDSLAGGAYAGDLDNRSYEDKKKSIDDRAAKIGGWIRAMNSLVSRKNIHLLILNQTRTKRGLIFGNPTTTPGGDGPKFFASLRLQLFGGKALKVGDQHVGKAVTFFVAKSRFSPPFRKAKVRLDYAQGWDNLWTTINFAKDRGVIEKGEKFTVATYHMAVEKLGWKNAAPVSETASTLVDSADDDLDDTELAEWAGETPE